MNELKSVESYQTAFIAHCISTGRIPQYSPRYANEPWHPVKIAEALEVSESTVRRRMREFTDTMRRISVAQCYALKERCIVNLVRDAEEARRMYDELTTMKPCNLCEATGCLFCNGGFVDPKENKDKLRMAERFLRTAIEATALIAKLVVEAKEDVEPGDRPKIETLAQAEEVFRRSRITRLAIRRPGEQL